MSQTSESTAASAIGATEYQARLDAVFSVARDGLLAVGPDGCILDANPAAAEVLACADLVGREFGLPLVATELVEIDLPPRDEQSRLAEMRVSPTLWAGQPAWLVALREITAQREAERRWQDAEAQQRQILDALQVHLVVVDQHGRIAAANQAWLNFGERRGLPGAVAVGQTHRAAMALRTGGHQADVEAAERGLRAVLGGQAALYEQVYPVQTPTGPRWYLLRATPLQWAAERGAVLLHLDVTDPRQAAISAAEDRLRADVQTALARREAHLERLSRTVPAPTTAASFGQGPLREELPEVWAVLARTFREVLLEAVEDRAFRTAGDRSPLLRHLSEELGTLRGGPRDVIDLYLQALRTFAERSPDVRREVAAEEGRMLALELMGYLVTYYRRHATAGAAGPELDERAEG
ncbi:MAG: PAS domain-containing protein [Fimbriimonadaceae bacterium]|nr:PAS domain-containing protein [Fimbriimonadaceae bacterium]